MKLEKPNPARCTEPNPERRLYSTRAMHVHGIRIYSFLEISSSLRRKPPTCAATISHLQAMKLRKGLQRPLGNLRFDRYLQKRKVQSEFMAKKKETRFARNLLRVLEKDYSPPPHASAVNKEAMEKEPSKLERARR